MSFRLRLIYYLVHQLQVTNKEAKKLIAEGKVMVDSIVVQENIILSDAASVTIENNQIRASVKRRIILFYKPRGMQSTLSEKVKDNLSGFFKNDKGLIIAGRLDKDSEGLLLLSNDGRWVEKICRPDFEKEKEYLVELDRHPDPAFFENFQKGVKLGNYMTRPCSCQPYSSHVIRVILREGKNRQIRRMCWNLGFGVVTLKRIRIDVFELGEIMPGECIEPSWLST